MGWLAVGDPFEEDRNCGDNSMIKPMKRLLSAVLLSLLAFESPAEDTSLFGTHWVRFEPLQIGGVLKGCSLVYLAVIPDHAYLGGNAVAVNGSIQLRDEDGTASGLMMILKIGLKDVTKDAQFRRPEFAYLQTTSGSTAAANQAPLDGEPGYKLFAYRALDPKVVDIMEGLFSNSGVKIGYNRRPGGIDVMVPLDLQVIDSEYSQDQQVHRSSSPENLIQFIRCTETVMGSVASK